MWVEFNGDLYHCYAKDSDADANFDSLFGIHEGSQIAPKSTRMDSIKNAKSMGFCDEELWAIVGNESLANVATIKTDLHGWNGSCIGSLPIF